MTDKEYIIGVFGKPASQRVILSPDYITAYRTARKTFPDECAFAVSSEAVAFVSGDPTPARKPRRRRER